jgi:hypothetical protein
LLLPVCLASTLAACSVSRQQQADEARTACRQDHPAVKGSYVALSECLDKADDLYWPYDDPDRDLVVTFQQARRGLANSVDAGRITPQDYENSLGAIQTQLDRAVQQLHADWGISHGLDESTKPDADPVPVLPIQ